jgi:hypothetical protein
MSRDAEHGTSHPRQSAPVIDFQRLERIDNRLQQITAALKTSDLQQRLQTIRRWPNGQIRHFGHHTPGIGESLSLSAAAHAARRAARQSEGSHLKATGGEAPRRSARRRARHQRQPGPRQGEKTRTARAKPALASRHSALHAAKARASAYAASRNPVRNSARATRGPSRVCAQLRLAPLLRGSADLYAVFLTRQPVLTSSRNALPAHQTVPPSIAHSCSPSRVLRCAAHPSGQTLDGSARIRETRLRH